MAQTGKKVDRAAVIGGGSFGTVLANLLAGNSVPTCLWMRDETQAKVTQQSRINKKYLPDLRLDEQLEITSDLQKALDGCAFVIVSVPSKGFRDTLKKIQPLLLSEAIIICSAKGIEADGFKLMSQIIEEELPQHRYGVISGPNLAVEIAQKQLSGTVVASKDADVCSIVQSAMHCSYFRVYASQDVYGVELGGVLKNIYAILAGMAIAIGVGQNTISLLMTRSIAEMSRFAVHLGANPMTFIGLAGMGDLIVTCSSPLSRNFRIGRAIGKGLTLDQAIKEVGQTAEGVNTLKLVKEKADKDEIYMPLASGLYEILFNNSTIEDELHGLMDGLSNSDVEFVVT